jgi:hypothetical protein
MVELKYPAIVAPSSGLLRDSLEAFIRSFLFLDPVGGGTLSGLDALAASVNAENRNLKQKFPDYRIDWFLEREVQVVTDSAGLVSLRCAEQTFLGGAHPLSTVRLASFEASSGRRFVKRDLIAPDSEKTFSGVLEKAFRTVRNLSPEANLKNEGFWIEEGKFPVTSNIAVRPDGLLFYYNPYEVAPYSMGPTEVFIPFNDLGGIVPMEGPLAGLVRP